MVSVVELWRSWKIYSTSRGRHGAVKGRSRSRLRRRVMWRSLRRSEGRLVGRLFSLVVVMISVCLCFFLFSMTFANIHIKSSLLRHEVRIRLVSRMIEALLHAGAARKASAYGIDSCPTRRSAPACLCPFAPSYSWRCW